MRSSVDAGYVMEAAEAPCGPWLAHADALRRQLLAHVDDQLCNPGLTPQSAATAVGISVRRLHLLLAGSPWTFSRLVAQRRVQRAQLLLAQQAASVADVAFDCGFNSLATFYRHYTAAFGTSPAGYRTCGAASLEPMTQAQLPCTQ